jgi:hypothetical protein
MNLEYFYRDKAPSAFNPAITEQLLAAANRRHDSAKHTVSMWRKGRYVAVNPDRYAFVVRRVK